MGTTNLVTGSLQSDSSSVACKSQITVQPDAMCGWPSWL